MKIDGKEIAQGILDNLKQQIVKFKEKNIISNLAIILVGDDPASIAYVNQKIIKAKSIGAKTTLRKLPSKISTSDLLCVIQELNRDENVNGIIIQQPLPLQIDLGKIINAVDPEKDVDGFHPSSHFQMPIVMAVLGILENIFEKLFLTGPLTKWLKSKKIVIIGKGETGGKPIIQMLKKQDVEPIIIDSKTLLPEKITKKADIIICAVGKANILKPQMLKKGVILIGLGIHRGKDEKLHGDYVGNEIKDIASFYTPIPGGIGPVNVAMLLQNLVKAGGKSKS